MHIRSRRIRYSSPRISTSKPVSGENSTGRRPRPCARSDRPPPPPPTPAADRRRRWRGSECRADLRSPASVDGATSSRSAIIRIDCSISSPWSTRRRGEHTPAPPRSGRRPQAQLASRRGGTRTGNRPSRWSCWRRVGLTTCGGSEQELRADKDGHRRQDHRERPRHRLRRERDQDAPGPLTVTLDNHGASSTRSRSRSTDVRPQGDGGKPVDRHGDAGEGHLHFECTVPGHSPGHEGQGRRSDDGARRSPRHRCSQSCARPLRRPLRGAYVRLTKPRVIELLLVTAVPPMMLAEQGCPPRPARCGRDRRRARGRAARTRSTAGSSATATS